MMYEPLADSTSTRARTGRPLRTILPVTILLLMAAAFLAYRTWIAPQPTLPTAQRVPLSAAELEERYGLRLKLLAVTAGGGLIDFRLKIVDAEKAAQLLASPEHTPSLIVSGSDVPLSAPRPTDQNQDPKLKDDDVFIALIPNSDSVVKPGTAVVVTFGDLQLEQPVQAQ
jgi:hypothetical protein